ncbi:unnamed protein product, partial [Staurois parvus]
WCAIEKGHCNCRDTATGVPLSRDTVTGVAVIRYNMTGVTRGGLTIWKLGHCPRACGQ